MDVKEAAAALDGSEYREEGSRELFDQMEAAGLVAVFGASDDLMEFRGAINDEVGCYDGGEAYLTPEGLLVSECDDDRCPYFGRALKTAAKIEASWSDDDNFAWVYITDIPHETFVVNEDGEGYCRGIVFRLADVPTA